MAARAGPGEGREGGCDVIGSRAGREVCSLGPGGEPVGVAQALRTSTAFNFGNED